MNSFFAPAVTLMNRLGYTKKFALLGLLSLISIVLLAVVLFAHLNKDIQVLQRELDGLVLIQPISQAVQLMQQRRGLSAALIGGVASMRELFAAKHKEADESFNAMDEMLPANLRRSADWQDIRQRWERLHATGLNWTVKENFAAHTQLIKQILIFETLVADNYALTLDTELDSYYMIDTVIHKLPDAIEHLGQLRARGTGILALKRISEQEKLVLYSFIAELKYAHVSLNSNLEKSSRYNPALRDKLAAISSDIISSAQRIIDVVEADILAERFATPPEEYFAMSTKTINANYTQMYETLLPAIELLLKERMAEARVQLYIVIGISLLLFLTVIYFSIGIARAVTGSVQSLSRSARAFASGDFSERIKLETRDELLQVCDSFNDMADGFNAMLKARREAETALSRSNANLEERVQERTEELQSQQEELRQTNEELEEKNHLLAEQKLEVEYKNREIEATKLTLEERAEQLALTSQYKSEFLSNMSHELRTPLNSLLILAQLLAENDEGNMSGQQIEYAKIIHGAGKDLLELINDILDLSKIESGTVTLDLQDVSFANLPEQVERTFRHVAESRGLDFGVELAPGLPPSLYTDSQRLQQVMKNLLSNAFKFTQKGRVSVRIAAVESGWSVDHEGLNRAQTVIGFYVTDTGIGLAADKQKIIFEAFQQADTGTARKYGGTGLGLSISREIAWLLGGELRLAESSLGNGSTFVLYLPLRAPVHGQNSSPATQEIMPLGARTSRPHADETPALPAADDRTSIKPGDRTLLIIEDDAVFAGILLRTARDKGFKGIVAARGDDGLELAGEFKPTAITLDLHLPDMDGWAVLDRLKRNPDTRHIPVEIISGEDNHTRGLRDGAFKYLVKPVTAESLRNALTDVSKFAEREVKDLLVADGDEQHRNYVLDLIGSGDVRIEAVVSGKDALAALKKKRYDCIVLDINLPDIAVADLLESIQSLELTHDVPVMIYGMDELPQKERERLKSLALKGIVKEVRTPERLFDETALFLHRVVSKLPEERRQLLDKLYLSADSLAGKKVLVVDDDVRNISALTRVLKYHKMDVLSAENGRAALDVLGNNPDVDIVLMDIMMPEMDGYEAMRQIRQMKQFELLPMIALTARAIKDDRAICIEAGASDYISKTVDTDQLVSLLRVWLYR